MNKEDALQTVYKHILEDGSILIKLREGQGLDEAAYTKLLQSMQVLIQEFKNSDTVPKKLALCFVDISNYFYFNEGKYSESEQDQIEDACHRISELANELFNE